MLQENLGHIPHHRFLLLMVAQVPPVVYKFLPFLSSRYSRIRRLQGTLPFFLDRNAPIVVGYTLYKFTTG